MLCPLSIGTCRASHPVTKEVETSAILAMAGHWREKYFKNDNPIVLELGCGRGEYTVGLAERNPHKNYILTFQMGS